MRSFFLLLAGAATLCHALPAADLKDRDFVIGHPTATLCIGSCRPTSPIIWLPFPSVTSIFHPGRDEAPPAEEKKLKREEAPAAAEKRSTPANSDIVSACGALAKSLPTSAGNSAFKMLMEECIMYFQQHDVDFKILGGWTHFGISDKVKRDGQIIIGQCTEDDINALTTQYKKLLALYGRNNIPYDVAVMMESIKAALLYCALASPTTGPLNPDPVIIGTPITPDPTVTGGSITPDPYETGGAIVPDTTIPGGSITPDN